MTSNGIIKLIIYKQTTDKTSYIYESMYDVFIGTNSKELGFSNEFYLNLSNIMRGSFTKCNTYEDKLVFTYELPKKLLKDDIDFLTVFEIQNINNLKFIDKPILVLVNNDFDLTKIKQFVNEYKEYGSKEYL